MHAQVLAAAALGAKRPRPDYTSVHTYGSETTITTPASLSHLSHPNPHYPQPPPIHSHTLSPLGIGDGGAYLGGHPLEYGAGNTRRRALTEDWGHVQKVKVCCTINNIVHICLLL